MSKVRLISALAGALAACSAGANNIVLTFEGIGDLNPVGNFYSGQGIDFSSNALGIVDLDAGGTGNFGGEPSESTVLFFVDGPAATMDFPDGFKNGLAFYYSAINTPGFVTIYDGPEGTGNILASLTLPVTTFGGAPDPTGDFSPFFPIGIAFSGTAKSVDFGGTINQIAFDNITFGTDIPFGLPDSGTSVALLGLALLGVQNCRRMA